MSRHGTAGKKRTGSIRPRGRPNEGSVTPAGAREPPNEGQLFAHFQARPLPPTATWDREMPQCLQGYLRTLGYQTASTHGNNYQQLSRDRKVSISVHTGQPHRDFLTPLRT